MLVHHHLVVKSLVKNPPKDEETMEYWLKQLIKAIGMNILYGPKAIYSYKEFNRGMTAFAIIDTSHIVLHSFDETDPADLQLDVYSCAEFSIDTIFDAMKIFDPTHIDYKVLDRTGDFIVAS